MTEEALRLLIGLALDAFADQAYTQMTDNSLHVGGDTEVSYSLYIAGNGYYTYYPDNVTGVTENCTFSISDGAFSEGAYFMSGEHVKWFVGGETTSGNYMDDINVVIANGTNYYLGVKSTSPGILFYPLINGGGATPQTELRFLDGNTPSYYVTGSYSIGQYNNICTISGMTATSSPTVHIQFPEAVYVPAPAGDTITYNEYRQQAITWANTTYNYNLTVNEFPEFEDLVDATEPTEAPQPVSLDYDEILGEDELESILNQETYNIPEYDTVFASDGFPDGFLEWWESNTEEYAVEENVAGYIRDNINVGFDFLQYMGLGGIFVSCASLVVIYNILNNFRNPKGKG